LGFTRKSGGNKQNFENKCNRITNLLQTIGHREAAQVLLVLGYQLGKTDVQDNHSLKLDKSGDSINQKISL
jgi:hypothetical protein